MTAPRRVLHVLSALDPGGAEMRTLEVQERLLEHGIAFDYVLLSGREGSLAHRATAMGSSLYPLPLDAGFPRRFRTLLRDQGYRVVHSHVATFSGAVLALARTRNVPGRVVHFRSDGDAHGDDLRRRAQRAVMRRLISRYATDILGVSPGSLSLGYRDDWHQDPRAQVLPNGIPEGPRRDDGEPHRPLALVNVGRPMPTKRRAFLGRVVDSLTERGIASEITCVGARGDDTDALERHAIEHGWQEHLHVLGTRDDVRQLLAGADVAVFPSTLEGLPGAVLESLATGLATVATDIPGTRFVAANTSGCVLIPEEAGPEAWADAIVQLQRDYPRPQMIADAFAASCFSLENAATTLRSVYGRHL